MNFPVKGTIKIYKFKNKYILSSGAFIQVENFSLTGLRLSSNLEFPVTKEMSLSMEFDLFGLKNQIIGNLAWKRKDRNSYIYGIEILSANMGYIQLVASLTKPVHKVTKIAQ